jgi:hypothetical protein
LTAVLQSRAKERRLTVGDTHGGKDDHKILTSGVADASFSSNLSGQLTGREPETREDRKLLAAHQRVQSVDRRDTRLNEFAGIGTCRRVDGQPVDFPKCFRHDRRSTIDRRTRTVEHSPQNIATNSEASGITAQPHSRRGQIKPAGTCIDLNDRSISIDFEHLSPTNLTVGSDHLYDLTQMYAVCPVGENERPRDIGDRL